MPVFLVPNSVGTGHCPVPNTQFTTSPWLLGEPVPWGKLLTMCYWVRDEWKMGVVPPAKVAKFRLVGGCGAIFQLRGIHKA